MPDKKREDSATGRLVATVLQENQLQLFDADGSDRHLDMNRHLDTYVPGRSQRARTALLQATVDLLGSWVLHLTKSSYQRPWFAGVILSPRWFLDGTAEPPAVLLRNDPTPSGKLHKLDMDLGFVWRYEQSLGGISLYRLGDEDNWYYWIGLSQLPHVPPT